MNKLAALTFLATRGKWAGHRVVLVLRSGARKHTHKNRRRAFGPDGNANCYTVHGAPGSKIARKFRETRIAHGMPA